MQVLFLLSVNPEGQHVVCSVRREGADSKKFPEGKHQHSSKSKPCRIDSGKKNIICTNTGVFSHSMDFCRFTVEIGI